MKGKTSFFYYQTQDCTMSSVPARHKNTLTRLLVRGTLERETQLLGPLSVHPACVALIKLNIEASGRPLSFARPCFSRTVPLSGVTRVLLIVLKRGISRGGQYQAAMSGHSTCRMTRYSLHTSLPRP